MSGGRRRQELPEEPLRLSGLRSERRYQTLFAGISVCVCVCGHVLADVFVTFDLSEKFDTDPRTLQPPEEKHFLNPRLSISTRFLSRFQDRIRSVYPQSSRALWPAWVFPLCGGGCHGDKSVSVVVLGRGRAELRLLSQSQPGSQRRATSATHRYKHT